MEVNAVNTEDIGRLKRALEDSISTGEFERSNDILQMIKGFHMTYDLLKSCKIGRSVGVLRKHPNKSIARMASEIVTSWKILCGAKETSGFDSTEEKYASMTLNDFLTLDLPDSLSSIKLFDGSVSFNENRSRIIKPPQISEVGPVVYWMSRDQRVQDNWAMIRAQQIALQQNTPLAVVFCLSPQFLGAPIRHYGFMLRGLKWLHSKLSHLNISFFLLLGDPVSTLPHFCNKYDVKTLMCDFSPLKISRKWKSEVLAQLGPNVAVHEVDAHNIAPCWKVSNKCEFSAKTIRPKIHNAMDIFLTEFPEVISHPYNWNTASNNGSPEYRELVGDEMWESVIDFLHVDTTVPELTRFESGEHSAESAMYDFISRIDSYSDNRNDPAIRNGVSHLSPYIHFGQLSTQRIVLEIKRAKGFSTPRALFPPGERTTGAHSYCEELVVRKELSDNFCLYNSQYDSIEGAHAWAQTTLRQHWNDPRPISYSQEQLENGKTGDILWNAAQSELTKCGKMHGFLRMYWAKKILEWTPNPAEALRIAIYLNDKYSLDGRDPNGYVGCMWAIAGVHDRAWGPERPIFGKIRYMNFDGCKRKFDIKKYIEMVTNMNG